MTACSVTSGFGEPWNKKKSTMSKMATERYMRLSLNGSPLARYKISKSFLNHNPDSTFNIIHPDNEEGFWG
ncbi:MAG: hypothetical protein LBC19_02780 [Tannerella sp.]|jgi:hypothetical protein|nr:hypothetical protein [Tannerella sp.]